MNSIRIKELEHGVTRLIIQSGRGNPLTPSFVAELNTTMDQLLDNPPRALIVDSDGEEADDGTSIRVHAGGR